MNCKPLKSGFFFALQSYKAFILNVASILQNRIKESVLRKKCILNLLVKFQPNLFYKLFKHVSKHIFKNYTVFKATIRIFFFNPKFFFVKIKNDNMEKILSQMINRKLTNCVCYKISHVLICNK